MTILWTDDRIYWVNKKSHTIQFIDLSSRKVASVVSSTLKTPSALCVFEDVLYYADQDDKSIHVMDKTTGDSNTILRNNIDNVLALKIYDPALQSGTNVCSINRGNCSHLCLPVSADKRVCACAAGFRPDPIDPTACTSVGSFIMYSINWEIKGYLHYTHPSIKDFFKDSFRCLKDYYSVEVIFVPVATLCWLFAIY